MVTKGDLAGKVIQKYQHKKIEVERELVVYDKDYQPNIIKYSDNFSLEIDISKSPKSGKTFFGVHLNGKEGRAEVTTEYMSEDVDHLYIDSESLYLDGGLIALLVECKK